MRKAVVCLLISVLLISLTGCDAMQRKFTRKKKEVKRPRIYQVKKYEKKPSPELYKKHYAWWTGWQSEILSTLGQNHKRDKKCMEEIISNLRDMQGLLVPEKADLLETHIRRLEEAKDVVFREDMGQANKIFVRTTLEREERYIKRDFCFSRIRDFIIKGYDDIEPRTAK